MDFNKQNIDIFTDDKWQKYSKTQGDYLKIEEDLHSTFDYQESEVNTNKVISSPEISQYHDSCQ